MTARGSRRSNEHWLALALASLRRTKGAHSAWHARRRDGTGHVAHRARGAVTPRIAGSPCSRYAANGAWGNVVVLALGVGKARDANVVYKGRVRCIRVHPSRTYSDARACRRGGGCHKRICRTRRAVARAHARLIVACIIQKQMLTNEHEHHEQMECM